MVIVLRKRKIFVLTLFLCLAACLVLRIGWQKTIEAAGEAHIPESRVFIIDAGHGGEDGGAVAADGTAESGINLAVALRLNELLQLYGQQTEMIRTEDVSLHTPELQTFRERKASDLKHRVERVNDRASAVLISIHQNSLPSVPSVHGAQAFYNRSDGAEELAENIQSALNTAINDGNEKKKRAIPEDIYLMNRVSAPAVLVECGFLSNAAETKKLQTSDHQLRLAAAILSGILSEQPAV